MTNKRQRALLAWLEDNCQLSIIAVTPLKHDASFRRYYRIKTSTTSFIAMDAPPPIENCEPFVRIGQALQTINIYTPNVYFQDLAKGFLLLNDLGDQVLLSALNTENVTEFYQQALNIISQMQTHFDCQAPALPVFTEAFMTQELHAWQDWFVQRFLNYSLSVSQKAMFAETFKAIAELAATQPYAFMHRDFHAANLMVLPDNQLGVLDFQDAFYGPVTYDVVSLLRDCYVSWPADAMTHLALRFKAQHPLLKNYSEKNYLKQLNNMALQRHLKALLTFSRKYVRDQDNNYLQHVSLTLRYVLAETQGYPDFHQVLKSLVPTVNKRIQQCVP